MSVEDKMVETVKVETYLKRLRCVNPDCHGSLESNGRQRSEGGVHGGPIEYQHRCNQCALGAWVKTAYPKVEYKVVPVSPARTAKIPIKGVGVENAAEGAEVS